MNTKINIEEFIKMACENIYDAARYEIESDNCRLAKSIYKLLFDFYDETSFSGDVIFTWKSPSLVKDGLYVSRREIKIDNKRPIGNLLPNYCVERKYSLNVNRNGYMGSFPHDYIDIYLDHVAKYAYDKDTPAIKEYYPLKRAILYNENRKYFKMFNGFEDFLEKNYLTDIWKQQKEKCYSDMSFEEFQKVSSSMMEERGIQMLKIMLEKIKTI